MTTFKNITKGSKGVNTKDGNLVFIDPGQSENLEVSDAELKAATATNWFEIDGDEDGKPVSLTGKTKAQLLEIAAAESVTVEEGATNADIVSAIELAREEADAA